MDGNSVWVTSGPNAIQYLRGKEVSTVKTLCTFKISYSV